MATEIDKRVVQMEFDNKDFEKNCKESLSTLEKLKMALNFDGAKGLKDVGEAAKKVDLSHISKGAEEVRAKFSVMQIAGMTAISELTKSALNFGKSIWSNTFGQMASGGMARTLKIDQARFQMKALANNFDEIAGDAEKLAYFMDQMHQSIDKAVSGTAYGYDAAAAVASQLMASGIKNADTMYNHLRAIAGAASMTGRSFEDIGNIFTTVASNGRLMTMQLRQFSAAGLNLSATLAKNLNKTEAQINDMVTKGKVSFEQFSKALYDAFGEAAGKADETWAGVTANVKAQLSRIGQIFTDPLVEKLIPVLASLKGVLKQVNTVLKPMQTVFKQVLKSITDSMKKTLDNFNVARLKAIANAVENIFGSIFLVLTAVKDAFSEVFPKKTADELYNTARNFEKVTQFLVPTRETLDGIKQAIKVILMPARIVYNLFRALGESAIQPLGVSLLNFISSILRLINTLEPFITALVDTIVESDLFNKILLTITGTIIIIINILTELANVATRVFKKLFDNAAVKTFLSGIQSVYTLIKNILLYGLYIVLSIMQQITSYITADNIVSVFQGLIRVIKYVLYLIQEVIGAIGIFLKGLSEDGSIIGNILLFIKELFLSVVAAFKGEDIDEHLKKVKDAAISIGDGFKQLFKDIMDTLKGIDVGKLMLIAFGMAVTFLVIQIALLVRAGTLLIRTVNGTAGILTKIKNAFLGIGRISPVAQLLFSLAIAIGVVTASLVTLSSDVDPERLKVAAAALGSLVGVMMGFSIVMAKLTTISPAAFDLGISQFIILMAAIAGSIWMMTTAIKNLSAITIDWEKFISPLIAVISLMVAMGGVIIGIVKLSGPLEGQFAVGAVSLLAFAVAIKILAGILVELTDVGLFKRAGDALMALIAIIGLIGTLSGAIATVALAGGSFGSGIAMIGIAISLLILISVLKKIADIPAEQIEKGFKRLLLICAPILTFIIAMGVITRVAGAVGFLSGFGGTFAGLTLLLAMMVGMVAILGSMNIAQLAIGIVAIALIGKILSSLFTKIIKAMYSQNPNAIGVAQVYFRNLRAFLIGLGAAMLMVGVAAKIMSGVDAMAVMGCGMLLMILGNMAIKFARVSKETEHARVAPIIAMIVAMGAMIAALAILSFQDETKVLAAAGALSACMFVMSILIAAIGKFSRQSSTIIAGTSKMFHTGQLVAIIGSIVAMILGVMYILNEFFLKTEGAASSGMSPELQAMLMQNGGSVQSVEKTTDWSKWGKLGLLLGGAALIVGMSVAIYKIIDKIAKTSTPGSILQRFSTLIEVFAIIAMALGSIYIVIYMMKDLKNPTDLLIAAGSLLMLLGGFASLLRGLSQLPLTSTINMIQVGIGLTIAASAVLVLAIALIPLAYFLNQNTENYVGLAASFGVLLVGIIALTFCLRELLKHSSVYNRNTVLKISIGLVIASSSLIIIAGAIAALAYVFKKIDAGIGHVVGAVVAIGAIAAVIFFGLYKLLKLTMSFRTAKIISISAAIVIASSIFLILAASIALMAHSVKGIGNDESAFTAAIIAFGACAAGLAALFGVLSAFSSKIDPTRMMLIGVAFAIFAGSIGIIGLIVAGIAKVANNSNIQAIQTAIYLFKKLLTVFLIMAAAGAIIGALGGFGGLISAGLYAVAGAFVIFAAAVYILTAAAENLVDAVDTIVKNIDLLNRIELKHDILTKNIAELKKITPEIVDIFVNAVHEINVGIGKLAYEIMAVGVSFVTGFIKGVNTQLPEILDTFLKMMKTVGEFLTNDENMEIIKDFCVSIAKVLYNVIVGVLADLFEAISDEILKLKQEYYEEDKKNMQKESRSKDVKKVKGDFLDYYSFHNLNLYEDAMDEMYDLLVKSGREKEAALLNANRNNPLWLPEYDDLTEKQKMNIEEVRHSRENLGITDEQVMHDLINNMKFVAEYSDKAFNSDEILEYGRKMSKLVGISEYYEENISVVNKIMNAAQKEFEKTGQAATEAAEEVETASEDMAESTKDAVEDVKDNTKEASEEGTDFLSGIFQKGTEMFGGSGGFLETLKQSASEGLSSFTNLFSGLGDSFGKELGISFDQGAFENCDLSAFFEKILNDGVTQADIAGLAAGKQYANSYFKSQEEEKAYYLAEANKIVQQPSVFNDPRSNGTHYWETLTDEKGNKLYKSAEDYMEKMYEQNHKYDALAETINGLGHSYDDVEEAMEAYDIANEDVIASNEEAEDSFKTLRDSIKDYLKNIFDDPGDMEFIDTDEMLYRMYENVRRVGQWARQLSELAARGMSEGLLNMLRDLGPAGAAKVDAFARMTAEQLQEANRLYLGAAGMPNQAASRIENSFREAGKNASLGFAEGIDPEASDQAMLDLANSGLDTLTGPEGYDENSPSKKTQKIGEYAVEGLINGLNDTKARNRLYSSAVRLAQETYKAISIWVSVDKAKELTKYFCDGLSNGFTENGRPVVLKASSIAAAIVKAFITRFAIGSPSRVMYDIGEYIMQGLGYGIDDGSSFVERQTGQTADAILEAMKDNLAMDLDDIGEDGVYSPVIRPVFDMSLMGGWNDITSWFASGQTLNLDGSISRLTPTSRDNTSNNDDVINAIKSLDVSGVRNEIQSMRNDISNLEASMSNLKVVMNTGALVGQLLNPLDSAMGQKAMLNSRGRY